MKIIKYQKKGRMWKLKANYFKYVSNFFGKHVYMLAVPERIYNSHYGNGVPAMFTS